MSDLTLYTNPMSRGRIARWMLEEVGQPYEAKVLTYGDEMKTDAYLALNPMGKVPTLVHGRAVVTEAAAICAYLADAFPEAGLAPDPECRSDYYRWMFFAAGPVEAAVTMKGLAYDLPPDKGSMVGWGSHAAVMDALDGMLSARDYVTGPGATAADVYLGAQVAWGLAFETLEPRPSLVAYAERMTARPAYLRAAGMDDALMPPADG